jgi:hypothetical protein
MSVAASCCSRDSRITSMLRWDWLLLLPPPPPPVLPTFRPLPPFFFLLELQAQRRGSCCFTYDPRLHALAGKDSRELDVAL